MSDDKQLSGMVVCDRNHKPHQRSPFAAGGACINPRPASPTPEQPAQDGSLEALARNTAVYARAIHQELCGGQQSHHGMCSTALAIAEQATRALAPPAQTQQGLSEAPLAKRAARMIREHAEQQATGFGEFHDLRALADEVEALAAQQGLSEEGIAAQTELEAIHDVVTGARPPEDFEPASGTLGKVCRLMERRANSAEHMAAAFQRETRLRMALARLIEVAQRQWDEKPARASDLSRLNEARAALNPDKQSSPSAAPAQEPESSKALRAATIQPQSTKEDACPISSNGAMPSAPPEPPQVRPSSSTTPAADAALTRGAPAMESIIAAAPRTTPANGASSPAPPAATATTAKFSAEAQPASPEGALREALEAALVGGGHGIGCDVRLAHQPSGPEKCTCWRSRAAAALAGQPAREDDQKALRAAALEPLLDAYDHVARCVECGQTGVEHCAEIEGEHSDAAKAIKARADAARALAGSPAGEGREDNQELLGKKGGEA